MTKESNFTPSVIILTVLRIENDFSGFDRIFGEKIHGGGDVTHRHLVGDDRRDIELAAAKQNSHLLPRIKHFSAVDGDQLDSF